MMFMKACILMILLLALFLTFKFIFTSFYTYESPYYQILHKDHKVEIRAYPEMRIAEIRVDLEQKNSSKNSIKQLIGYISGNNQTHENIAMTIPVLKIKQDNIWSMAFIMPAKYDLDELPTPNAPVSIRTIPSQQFLVLRFSGSNTQKRLLQQQQLLETYAQQHHCQITQNPIFAFYNRPRTLSFLKRNEIWLSLTTVCPAKIH